jgi:hypothetical protein
MKSGHRIYSCVENITPEELSNEYINVLEDDGLEVSFVPGNEMSSNWRKNFRKLEFRSDRIWIDFYYPEKENEDSYVVSYMSIQPETDIYDSSVQETLISVVRQMCRQTSPRFAYLGSPLGVYTPDDSEERPKISPITYLSKKEVGKFEVDVHQAPGCNAEAVGDGVLIYPEGNIMEETLDETAEYLGTGLADRPS